MIFQIVEKFRPILLKIFPQSFLKAIKNRLVERKEKALFDEGIKPFDVNRYQKGVNLIGPLKTQNGLGQSSRLIADLLKQSEFDCALCDYSAVKTIARGDTTYDAELTEELPYGINLIHLNPFELRMAYLEKGKSLPDYRYNIGYWLWELEQIPDDWLPALSLVDEIWTPSEYISNNFRKVTDKPVYTHSYCVEAPTDEKYGRQYFGLPQDQFLYLIMYDSQSTSARKNPAGAIAAYQKAFPAEQANVGLVIKINNSSKEDKEKLQKELKDYQNVYFITDTLSKIAVNSLVKAVDVFVSLHRAEGYGLVMAEAMLNNTACIATNYSSNTEFMNDEVACMIGYELVNIVGDSGFYLKNSTWAEPHIDEAANQMRKLYEDSDFYKQIVANAKAYIDQKMSKEQLVLNIQERLEQIYAKYEH